MPDPEMAKSRRAAEEIAESFFPLLREGKCSSDCDNCIVVTECKQAEENATATMTDIIDRHRSQAERTLQAAAKWAARGCPVITADGCLKHGEDCIHCWLEFWRKEAEG